MSPLSILTYPFFLVFFCLEWKEITRPRVSSAGSSEREQKISRAPQGAPLLTAWKCPLLTGVLENRMHYSLRYWPAGGTSGREINMGHMSPDSFSEELLLRPDQGRDSRVVLKAFICPRSSRRSWEDLKQEGHSQIYSFRKKIALLELLGKEIVAGKIQDKPGTSLWFQKVSKCFLKMIFF